MHRLNQISADTHEVFGLVAIIGSAFHPPARTGALFRQGATVAEMQKDKAKLAFLVQAREKKQWVV